MEQGSWSSQGFATASGFQARILVPAKPKGFGPIKSSSVETSSLKTLSTSGRVQEKNNCPLRFYLGLNLSTRLSKSTKCYGQLSIQWTIVHTMSISWTIVHEMDNCYTIVHIVGNAHS